MPSCDARDLVADHSGADGGRIDAGYQAAIQGDAAKHTVMTHAISGLPARSLPNRFTKFGAQVEQNEMARRTLASGWAFDSVPGS